MKKQKLSFEQAIAFVTVFQHGIADLAKATSNQISLFLAIAKVPTNMNAFYLSAKRSELLQTCPEEATNHLLKERRKFVQHLREVADVLEAKFNENDDK